MVFPALTWLDSSRDCFILKVLKCLFIYFIGFIENRDFFEVNECLILL